MVLKELQVTVDAVDGSVISPSLFRRPWPEVATRGTGRRIFCHFTGTEGDSPLAMGSITRLRRVSSKLAAVIFKAELGVCKVVEAFF